MIHSSQKRSFGSANQVSIFTLGSMRALDSVDQMCEIVRYAYESGINHIETAPSYGNAEKYIGKALNKLERTKGISKEKWIITTKVLPIGNFKRLKNNFLTSLKSLNIKKINNLAIHGLNLYEHFDWVTKGEGKQFIEWVIETGLVDQIGFSSHGKYELIEDAINSDLFSFCSLHLHLLDQSKFPLAKKALKKNMGVLAISPADKGGKLYAPSNLLLELSKPYTPLEIAYRFLLANGISTLSLGANKFEDFNLPKKLANSTHKLSKLEKQIILRIQEEADKRLGHTKCAQCKACLPCPNNVPIPELLRLRNIYLGYDQKEFAKERYNLIVKAGHWWEENN